MIRRAAECSSVEADLHLRATTKTVRALSSKDVRKTKPRVLLVYYGHTKQAKRVSDAMAEVLRGRDCDITQAGGMHRQS